MIIHDFKTLLSKVKVGDEVIVHQLDKNKVGFWAETHQGVFIVDYIQDVIIDLHHKEFPRALMIITNAEFHDPQYKFELPE